MKAIVGFITSGTIGTVCVDHIVRANNLKHLGPIVSENMDPSAMIIDNSGVLSNITRAYGNDSIIAVICEISFIDSSNYFINEIADVITSFLADYKASEVLLIDSFESSKSPDIFISSSYKTPEEINAISNTFGVKTLSMLLLYGINASMLSRLCIRRIDNLIVLSAVDSMNANVHSYINVLNFISRYMGCDVDVDKFKKQFEQFNKDVEAYKNEIMKRRSAITNRYIT